VSGYRLPWDPDPDLPIPPARPARKKADPKPRGRRPAPARAPSASRHDEGSWVYHRLTVHGPKDDLAGFAEAARGSGIIPWQHDAAVLEEDLFLMLAKQPATDRRLSIEGCHILTRQLALRITTHRVEAAAHAAHSRACPFDLHVLLPVPDDLLRQDATKPAATAWMRQHWGPTDALRKVVVRLGATAGKRLPDAHGVISYGFFSLDGTPSPAVAALERRWPGLVFQLQSRPDD